jgi:hypothetical protein
MEVYYLSDTDDVPNEDASKALVIPVESFQDFDDTFCNEYDADNESSEVRTGLALLTIRLKITQVRPQKRMMRTVGQRQKSIVAVATTWIWAAILRAVVQKTTQTTQTSMKHICSLPKNFAKYIYDPCRGLQYHIHINTLI